MCKGHNWYLYVQGPLGKMMTDPLPQPIPARQQNSTSGCFFHSLCPAPSSMEAMLCSFCPKSVELPQLTAPLWLVGGSQLCAVAIQ